jgi:hypothetical protein
MWKCEEKKEKNIEILERRWPGVCKIKIQISKTRKITPLRTKNHVPMSIKKGHRINFHF